jgi:segregation and condensation protein B
MDSSWHARRPEGSEALEALKERALDEAERIAEALVFASSAPVAEKLICRQAARQYVPVDALLWRGWPNAMLHAWCESGPRRGRLGVSHGSGSRLSDPSGGNRGQETLARRARSVLSTIAYHQPVTRAEIEDVRGVATSKGTLDVLMETGWVRMRGRRRSPGAACDLWHDDAAFLDHFGLEDLRDLPGMDELKGAGLLSGTGAFQLSATASMPLNDDELT